jgi:uncharacterized protein (UPF0303 family)
MQLIDLINQEKSMEFSSFNSQIAWELGTQLRFQAEQLNAPVIIEVYAFGLTLFLSALPGSKRDNYDWLQRKRNTVLRFGRSSMYVGEYHRNTKSQPFEQLQHIDHTKYSAHGGSFPINLKGCGLIGAITVSGLPQREDHNLIVAVLEAFNLDSQHG